jgi:YesN/AraC family two-component response regulator
LDYLVKPIDEKELASAIRKLTNYKKKSANHHKIQKALDELDIQATDKQINL